MKKLIHVITVFAALLSATIAHAQYPKSTLDAQLPQSFPDNTYGYISPALLRSWLEGAIASWQQYAAVNAQIGTSYTVQTSDYGQLVTFNNSGAVAVTLPSAASAGFYPFSFYASNLGAGAVTITPATGTINGASTLVLAQNQSTLIISDQANWQIVRGTASGSVINSGAAHDLAYYATSGTAISGLASCASGVYLTNGSNVPSCGTTLPTSLTYPSPTWSGTATAPDSGTWDSTGINGSVIGASTAENGTFATLNFTTLSPTSLAASPSTITGLTVNNSPDASTDYFLYYSAGTGTIEKCTIGSCTSASAAGVSSLNGLTGGLSVVQGSGITVAAAGTSVTVTNAGVTSAVAGTGIAVSGTTGAVTVSTTKTPILLNTIQTPTGVTATFTNSSAVIGATNTFVVGQAVVFTTTGGLPTNFTAGTVYYVISTGLSSSQCEVASTIGGSAITAGSAGTGTQTVTTYWVDTTSMTNTYSSYNIVYENLVPATSSNTLSMTLGTSSTFIGGTSNIYQFIESTSTTVASAGSTGAAAVLIGGATQVTNADPGISGNMTIYNPSGSQGHKTFTYIAMQTGPYNTSGGGWITTSSAVTMLQFYFSVGGVPSSGVVRIYGIP